MSTHEDKRNTPSDECDTGSLAQGTPRDEYVQRTQPEQHPSSPGRRDEACSKQDLERPRSNKSDQEVTPHGYPKGLIPKGNPGIVNKIIGKVEKAAGKYFNNPKYTAKGELRESGITSDQIREAHDRQHA